MSRHSFVTRTKKAPPRGCGISGEGKEHLLQSCSSSTRASPEVFESALAPYTSSREQYKPAAKPLSVTELMNGDEQRSVGAAQAAKNPHDLACLPEIETIERLIDHDERLRREQTYGEEEMSGDIGRARTVQRNSSIRLGCAG
jgi:hypothetical protein